MNLVVSTCGTSTLTNMADETARRLVSKYANFQSIDQVADDARTGLQKLIDAAKGRLSTSDIPATKLASAELNGILCLAAGKTPLPSSDVHVLLHTDTWLGTVAAEIVAEKLRSYGAEPQLQKIHSLSTESRELFDDGLRNLVEWAAQTLPGYRAARYHLTFNLVGGFKSVQGFMQTLGMFYADEIIYVFETGSELLRIPRLPVDLDAAARSLMEKHQAVFRLFSIDQTLPADDPRLTDIPQTMLYWLDDQCEWSPWGKLLWEQIKPDLYRKQLLDSPTDRIVYTEAFSRSARNIQQVKIPQLNERIDDLARHLLDPSQPNPRRLDLKRLKGDPRPPSTHEADAWADADCKRLFLRFDVDGNGRRAVIELIDSPLH